MDFSSKRDGLFSLGDLGVRSRYYCVEISILKMATNHGSLGSLIAVTEIAEECRISGSILVQTIYINIYIPSA